MIKLICVKMNNIIYKETILCLPTIVLIILIGLVEMLTIYKYNNIVILLKNLIVICTPSNFLVKSLLPGYIITIFTDDINYIIKFNYLQHPIIKQHVKKWNNVYNFYYSNYLNILLPILQLSYTMMNTKNILNATNTHSWRLLFPFMMSNIIIIFTIMCGTLLYFYYVSLNNIYNIHRNIEINKSIIDILARDLYNIHNLIDNDEIELFESKLLSIKTNLIETNNKNDKLNKNYEQEVSILDSILKTFTIICALSICCFI